MIGHTVSQKEHKDTQGSSRKPGPHHRELVLSANCDRSTHYLQSQPLLLSQQPVAAWCWLLLICQSLLWMVWSIKMVPDWSRLVLIHSNVPVMAIYFLLIRFNPSRTAASSHITSRNLKIFQPIFCWFSCCTPSSPVTTAAAPPPPRLRSASFVPSCWVSRAACVVAGSAPGSPGTRPRRRRWAAPRSNVRGQRGRWVAMEMVILWWFYGEFMMNLWWIVLILREE